MELQYIVLTIIKILISVPTLVHEINGAALIGGHVNNAQQKSNITEFKIDLSEDNIQEESAPIGSVVQVPHNPNESVPNPEPLIVAGYNLPENIFNKGKPFYLEKDPLTGNIDFNSRTKLYDEYDYEDVEYDKSTIDRKDGPVTGSHKPSDINQLTPNFHDFLNLPVKYNPDKYVYPLISSSYANTKVQGNVNKHQNHKNYVVTTYKPTLSPTYFTTKYYHTQNKVIEFTTPKKVASIQFTSPTTPKMQTTKRIENLMNSPMNHPSYNDYIKPPTTRLSALSSTTPNPIPSSTKRAMTLFEQLFGSDYEENEMTDAPLTTSTTTEAVSTGVPPKTQKPQGNQQIKLFHNLPKKATTPVYSTTHHNVLTGSHMSEINYEDDYEEEKPAQVTEVSKKPPLLVNVTPDNENMSEEYDYDYLDKTTAGSSTAASTTTTSTTTEKPSSTLSMIVTPLKPTFEHTTTEEIDEAPITTTTTESIKMTSLPLGENHIHHMLPQRPIIVTGQNLREQLNGEKVGYLHPQAPSTSSIHIAPDQDTVSFVMGNHQNVQGAGGNGGYVGTSLKESPYESNPFRPVYDSQPEEYQVKNEYQRPYQPNLNNQQTVGSSVTIQPIKNNEASLAIGSQVVLKPGQVVDEKIEDLEYTHGSKIVFPDGSGDKSTTSIPDLSPPPPPPKVPVVTPSFNVHAISHPPTGLPPNIHKEVLKLNSKPMFHQLPSELTPPENVGKLPQRVRPPWDPRPGHFHAGRPEYARPPRPQEVYKRVDNLPNILPQFRPNMGGGKPVPHHHQYGHMPHGSHFDRNHYPHQYPPQQGQQHKHAPPPPPRPQHEPHGPSANVPPQNYARQPLLERPSNNRPIGFFEKLHPPPPGPPQSKIPSKVTEERIGPKPTPPNQHQQVPVNNQPMQEHFAYLQAPPKIVVPNRRNGEDPETLQMLQAKQEKKDKPVFKQKVDVKENIIKETSEIIIPKTSSGSTDKPLYVVYPVNSAPIKLDALENNKKESVVIGTRAELPLPPSKIKPNPPSSIATESDFNYEVKDRHDSPILKPRPATFPFKSDFPYPLERPNPSMMPTEMENKLPDEPILISSNQWNTIEDTEPRIINHNPPPSNGNQISVTLKTYTEKPIAVAYTPTESSKFSMPNYASLVIPEIRDSEITVSAVMHHGQPSQPVVHQRPIIKVQPQQHVEEQNLPRPQQEFQAPFQASAHVDHSMSQGWAVVRDAEDRKDEITTLPAQTTSEFDIENFKPQLEGGFKPIYSYSEDSSKESKQGDKDLVINERQE